MAGSNSQYLQVPKLSLRRPRSPPQQGGRSNRPRSRQRDERPEAVVSAVPGVRPQSPPMPAAQRGVKPSLNGFTTPPINTARETASSSTMPYTNGAPDIRMADLRIDEPQGTNYDDLSVDLNGAVYTLEQCVTPPPELPLRQKLIGTWKLESYTAYPTATSRIQRPTFPMTKNVTGTIMYTPDGYMSSHMLIPGQLTFARGEGDDAQWTEAAKRFFGYCGPFYITNEGVGREETLRHTFQICNLPGWVGDIQVRTHRFEENGEVLVLGSEEPAEIKGDPRIPELKWRRARNNVNAVAPPPTPQIKVSKPGEA